jgi:hypothetical protein
MTLEMEKKPNLDIKNFNLRSIQIRNMEKVLSNRSLIYNDLR